MSEPQYLDYIPYPEFGEVLKMGNEEDKVATLSELNLSELFNLEKIDIDDLPDILRDNLIFKIEEKDVEVTTCIVVYEGDNLFLIRSSEPDIQEQCTEIEKLLTKKFENIQLEIVNPFK